MDVAKLRILVDLDSAGVVRGAATSAAAIAGFERSTTQALSRVTTGFSRMSTAQKGLLGVSTAAILVGTALSATIGPAIEFESAFAGVEKTVDGTPEQLAAIRDGLLDLSSTIPTTSSDLADIAANAGQLGVEAPKILAFTETVAGLGETTDLDFDSAAQSLARFLNVTGNDVEVQQLGDAIVDLGNNSATTESQILTFAQRMAAAFTVAGATEADILGLAAAMSSMGVEAEAGASSLNTSIGIIVDAAKLGGNELQVLADTAGLTTDQFRQLALDNPVEAMLAFARGLGEVNAEGRSITPILEQLGLDGLRTTRVMQLLALNAEDVAESMGISNAQFENGGALAEEAGKRYETTAARLEILNNRLRTLAIRAGTPALDLVAASADAVGDALVYLFDQLAPVGATLQTTFENLGEAARIFFEILGRPALGILAASLVGAATSAAALLDVLNSFGPVGAVIAGVIVALVAFPGALATAVSAGAALATTLSSVGVSGTAAAAGVRAAQLAASAGPFIAVAAALAILGKAFIDIGNNAREAGDKWESSFTSAIEDADYRGVEASLDSLRRRQEELEEQTGRSGGKWSEFVAGFKSGLGGGGNLQAVTDFESLNAELDELEGRLESTNAENFIKGIDLLAQNLGVTGDEAIDVANELGLVDEVIRLGEDSMQGYGLAQRDVVTRMRAHFEVAKELEDRTGILADKILAGTAATSDYAEALGLTEAELVRLVDRIDGIEIKDFTDGGEGALRALDAVEELLGGYKAMADQLGITTNDYRSQIDAVEDLAGSHGTLRKAVDDAANALAAMGAQQRITAEAADAYNEALDNIGETGGLEAAAAAMRTLSLETAASGISASEAAARQRELYLGFLEAAEGAGIAREEAVAVAIALGLVPEAILAEITVDGEQAKQEATEFEQLATETARRYEATLDADGEPARNELGELQLQIGGYTQAEYVAYLQANGVEAAEATRIAQDAADEFALRDYIAQLQADGLSAEEAIATVGERARLWADTEYLAFLEANNIDAESVIGISEGLARTYADSEYNATLTATDNASGTIAGVQGKAQGYANGFERAEAQRFARIGGRAVGSRSAYNATLTATDNASPVINAAKDELVDFRSKSITLTATYVTRGSNPVSGFRTGGISVPTGSSSPTRPSRTSTTRSGSGSSTFFADGGFSVPFSEPFSARRISAHKDGSIADILAGGVRETPGTANIYQAATTYRIFAERPTGWEAYIPGNGDPARNYSIWSEAGHRLGFMAHGGIMQLVTSYQNGGITGYAGGPGSTTLNIAAPISIDLSELPAGTDFDTVIAVLDSRLEQAFADLGRKILNTP